MNDTKRKERYYFEMFRRDFPLPKCEIEYTDRPDVILRGERTIGVEITNFYLKSGHLPASEQKQCKKRDVVVSTAQRLYREQSGKDVGFAFGFDKDHPIKNEKVLASSIAALATVLLQEPWGRGSAREIPAHT